MTWAVSHTNELCSVLMLLLCITVLKSPRVEAAMAKLIEKGALEPLDLRRAESLWQGRANLRSESVPAKSLMSWLARSVLLCWPNL